MLRDDMLESVIAELGYADSDSLMRHATSDIGSERAISYLDASRRLNVDAVYFIGSHPTVFFAYDDSLDNQGALELQNKVWNHNQASKLVAVSSECCWVFDCDTPARSVEERDQQLGLSIRAAADAIIASDVLAGYRRYNVISPESDAFEIRDSRVDSRLLKGLHDIREALLKDGISDHTIMRLVTKSVFAKYLEDRGVLTSQIIDLYFNCESIQEILRSPGQTAALFDFLSERFNGDLFSSDDAIVTQISSRHLALIADFLDGHDIQSGQQALWPFDFEYIPIQVLSSVYEVLLHHDKRVTGSYYTPSSVARFMIAYSLQYTRVEGGFKVLDPSCGSGLFLVEAYQHLVFNALMEGGLEVLNYEKLESILTTSIFGIDIDQSAVEVASLGLYLALLDHISPKAIWESVKLPKLIGRNLFVQDAFEENASLEPGSFDLVLGNPPWISSLTPTAEAYVSANKLRVSDNQVAIALLWRATSFLSATGMAAILMPSKPLLHNRSENAVAARETMFGGLEVVAILDLSLFRKSLFVHATAPAAAVFARRFCGGDRISISHMAPRPSRLSLSTNAIVIASDEINVVDFRVQESLPFLWKTLLVGSPRDVSLIEYLVTTFQSLGQVANHKGWSVSSGYAVGNKSRQVPEMGSLRRAESKSFRQFWVESSAPNSDLVRFERPRALDTYLGPKLLIKQGIRRKQNLLAAFTEEELIFSNKTTSIAPTSRQDVGQLKAIAALMNSALVRYFMFMTAASWGVERDFVQQIDILSTPVFDLDNDDGRLIKLAEFTERMSRRREASIASRDQNELDDMVFELFNLQEQDVQTVRDGLEFSLDAYATGLKSNAFHAPDKKDLERYISSFSEVFRAMLSETKIVGELIAHNRAHVLVRFSFDGHNDLERKAVHPTVNQSLQYFSDHLDARGDSELIFSRTVFIYGQVEISMIKPAERRFWNHTAGENDADRAIASLFHARSSAW